MGLFDRFRRNKKTLLEADLQAQVLAWISSLAGTGEREVPSMTRDTMEAQAYQGFQTNPSIYNYVSSMASFLFGAGVQISHASDKVNELISDFRRENKFDRKAVELGHGYYITGIRFPVLYINTLTGECKLREFDPYTVKNIVTSEDDYEDILGLYREYNVKKWNEGGTSYTTTTEKEFVKQGDTVGPYTVRYFFVWKRPTVAGETRGWTFLAPVLHFTTMLREFLKMRLNIQRALASFAWIWNLKNLKGNFSDKETEVAAFQAKLIAQGPPPPGATLTTHEDAEIKAESTGINAGRTGAEGDYRAIGLQIATGTSMPEFIATGDASNANYSSLDLTLRAVVKMFEKEQTIWLGDGYFGELFDVILAAWADAGLISDADADIPVTITPPVITQDDLNQLKNLLEFMFNSKIITGRTVAALTPFDIDYDKDQDELKIEKEEKAKEREEEGLANPPPNTQFQPGQQLLQPQYNEGPVTGPPR